MEGKLDYRYLGTLEALGALSTLSLCFQSVLGKVNEIAKHKASVEDADTQSKVRKSPFPHFYTLSCSLVFSESFWWSCQSVGALNPRCCLDKL